MGTKNLISSLFSGLLSGAIIGVLTYYQDETNDKASFIQKVKEMEAKIYHDGENQALQLANLKQEAKLKAKMDVAELNN